MNQKSCKVAKKLVCCLFLIFSINAISPVEYKTFKDSDNMTIINYYNPEHEYQVVAHYYKLYFEIKVEIYFYRGLPSKETLASIESEQFFYLTRYFKELPYRPPISKRKINSGRNMYSFTVLYKGRVIDNY